MEAELQLVTLEQAEGNPVGRGRKEPEPLDKPKYDTHTHYYYFIIYFIIILIIILLWLKLQVYSMLQIFYMFFTDKIDCVQSEKKVPCFIQRPFKMTHLRAVIWYLQHRQKCSHLKDDGILEKMITRILVEVRKYYPQRCFGFWGGQWAFTATAVVLTATVVQTPWLSD